MLYVYNVLLLALFFEYSASFRIQHNHDNRTIIPSRSIYELVEIRRAAAKFAAYRNRTKHNITLYEFKKIYTALSNINSSTIHESEEKQADVDFNYNRYFRERLIIMVIISGVTLLFMIVVVATCIIVKLRQDKTPQMVSTIEQRQPLNSSPRINITKQPFETNSSTRSYSHRSKIASTPV